MNKLLIVVLLAAAGVLLWLVLSKTPASTAVGGSAPISAGGALAGKGALPVLGGDGADRTVANAAHPITAAPPAFVSAPPAAITAAPEGDTAAANGVAPPPPAVGGHGPGGSRYGRQAGQGMLETPMADVKTTVRRYWSNLPKNGVLPATVTAEEVFSPAMLQQLNLPPQSRVTMLGDFPVSDKRAFDALFNKPDNISSMFGYSAVMPDGVEVRDYVRLVAPK